MIINNHKHFRYRLSIDYQHQSINWYRLSSIAIDYRFHRLFRSCFEGKGIFNCRVLRSIGQFFSEFNFVWSFTIVWWNSTEFDWFRLPNVRLYRSGNQSRLVRPNHSSFPFITLMIMKTTYLINDVKHVWFPEIWHSC